MLQNRKWSEAQFARHSKSENAIYAPTLSNNVAHHFDVDILPACDDLERILFRHYRHSSAIN